MQTRTIKFRAWDKITDQMYNWNDIYSIHRGFKLEGDNNYSDIKLTCSMPDGSGFKPYDFELMQYTGLKDKNGVEIYEGDVVEWSDGKLLSEVYWDQADVAFSLRCNGESWFLNDDSMLCGMEVVGNIYENHELVDK